MNGLPVPSPKEGRLIEFPLKVEEIRHYKHVTDDIQPRLLGSAFYVNRHSMAITDYWRLSVDFG